MARSFSFGTTPDGGKGITRIVSDNRVTDISRNSGDVAVIEGGNFSLHKGPETPSTQISQSPDTQSPGTKPTGFDFQ